MTIRLRAILFVLVYLLSNVVFAAGVYRWVDEQGNVQFGDDPGRTKEAKSVKLPAFKGADPAYLKRLEQQKKYLNARQEERQKGAESKVKDKKLQEEMAARCKDAQDRLKMFTESSQVYVEENGGRRYLDKGQMSTGKQRANDEVKKYCR